MKLKKLLVLKPLRLQYRQTQPYPDTVVSRVQTQLYPGSQTCIYSVYKASKVPSANQIQILWKDGARLTGSLISSISSPEPSLHRDGIFQQRGAPSNPSLNIMEFDSSNPAPT